MKGNMSNIILGEDESKENDDDTMKINYQPTEADEECYFLVYHLHMQPSEAYNLEPEHRKWFIARTIAQKQMEHEMIERQKLAARLGPNLKI